MSRSGVCWRPSPVESAKVASPSSQDSHTLTTMVQRRVSNQLDFGKKSREHSDTDSRQKWWKNYSSQGVRTPKPCPDEPVYCIILSLWGPSMSCCQHSHNKSGGSLLCLFLFPLTSPAQHGCTVCGFQRRRRRRISGPVDILICIRSQTLCISIQCGNVGKK